MPRWKIVHDGLLFRRFRCFDLNLDVLLDLRFLIRRHTSSTEYLRVVVVVDFIDFVFLLCCCFTRNDVMSFEMDCKNVS